MALILPYFGFCSTIGERTSGRSTQLQNSSPPVNSGWWAAQRRLFTCIPGLVPLALPDQFTVCKMGLILRSKESCNYLLPVSLRSSRYAAHKRNLTFIFLHSNKLFVDPAANHRHPHRRTSCIAQGDGDGKTSSSSGIYDAFAEGGCV